MLSKDELATALDAELQGAIDVSMSSDGGSRQTALDYYRGLLPSADDPTSPAKGYSLDSAVSLDVADMIEAVYAQLAPALEDAGGIKFEALDPDDESAAQTESDIVRSMLMDGWLGTGGFIALSEAIKDALLLRSGVLALWIDRSEYREPERYEDIPAEALQKVLSPRRESETVEDVNIEVSDDDAGEATAYDVSLTRVEHSRRLAMRCIPREDWVCSSSTARDAEGERFSADRVVQTRAQWIREGFDADLIASLPVHHEGASDLYLNRGYGTPESGVGASSAVQVSSEMVELWRCYVMLGESLDSPKAERFRVWYSREGRITVSEPERVGRVCYAVGQAILFAHRLDGVSLFDRLGEVQVSKSLALRQWQENLHRVNRPRLGAQTALLGQAGLDALADARNDVIPVSGPDAIMPIPTVDAGPSVLAFLGYQDQARSERGGASLDMQSASMQIASNQTAQGIERQYSVKEQLAAAMVRTFAETAIRSAYIVAHYLLRTAWGGTLQASIGGEWRTLDPSAWRPRTGVSVKVGESRTQRAERSMALAQVMQAQAGWMQSGARGVLTDEVRMFNAASDWLAAQQLRGPERYLIDPRSPGAQQAAQQSAQAGQQQAAQQAALVRAQLMLQKYEADLKAQTDSLKVQADLASKEAELTMNERALQMAQVTAAATGAAAGQDANQTEAALSAAGQSTGG